MGLTSLLNWSAFLLDQFFTPSQFIPNFYKFFRNSSDEAALKELVDFFQRLEKLIKAHGENSFLAGGVDKPGAVDYLVWPWIERSLALKILSKGIVLKTQTWQSASSAGV